MPPLPIGKSDSEAAVEHFPSTRADLLLEKVKGRRAVKVASEVDCKLAREAADVLNRVHVVSTEVMQAFFARLKDRVHDEVCGQAAVEEDRL